MDTCCICLNSDDGYDGDIVELNCGHIYHLECIEKWMDNNNNTCPLCKSNITSTISVKDNYFDFGLMALIAILSYY
jgi:hypothetical protein